MSNSTVVEWLEENSYRAYPLTPNSPRWLTVNNSQIDLYALLLDANFVYYTSIPNSIALTNITVTGTTVTFTVTGLPTFSFDTSTQSSPTYVRNSNNDLLVIGDTSGLLAVLSGPITITDVSFEPSVAIELTGSSLGVTSLTINGNTLSPGDVTLVEGYQTGIQFAGNNIKLAVGRNEGMPLGCQQFFSNTSDCNSIVSAVNGASPRNTGGTLTLKAGTHVKLFEDPERNRIYVGVDFDTEDSCVVPLLSAN